MRISIDCRYVRERPSGIGAYVQALIDRLPTLTPGDDFLLWVDPRARRPLSPSPRVAETVVSAAANSLPTLLWPARLCDLSGVDVLHLPSNLLGRGIRCPTVVTVHDLIWLLAPASAQGLWPAVPAQWIFYGNGIRRALRQATRIVTVSAATADSIGLVVPEAKRRIRVITHGIEACYQPPADVEQAGALARRALGSADPYFLVIGQNAPYKNHGAILEAFAAARLAPEVRLCFVQRLYGGDRLARRARELGLAERVRWLEPQTRDELIALMQSTLALVQFSRFEGFGMPVAEAMACGAPVIASDIPALSEVSGGAALQVPLHPPALSAALERVAADPGLRRELSAKGVERARGFSWDCCAALHLEAYREAAADGDTLTVDK